MSGREIEQRAFVDQLGQLLAAADAQVTVSPNGIAPSTLYDATYHLAIIAIAFQMHAAPGPAASQRILAEWLKLLQFAAARPLMAANLLKYAEHRRDGDLEKWALMPRGYLGDLTHDSVVDLLVATGVLRRDGDVLEAMPGASVLGTLASAIEKDGLFLPERGLLEKLKAVRVSKALLGGM